MDYNIFLKIMLTLVSHGFLGSLCYDADGF